MEGIRFCSCQVLLLSLELSVVQKRKTSAWNNYSYNDKWRISCPGGTFRSLEKVEKEEVEDLFN